MCALKSGSKLIHQYLKIADNIRRYIIIVDDEKDILDLFQEALEMKGLRVKTFLDPCEALSHIQKDLQLCSLIITDIRMPEMSGIEFVQRVRKISSDIKIIFMTAFEMEKGQIKEMDTIELLRKPIRLENLITMVTKVLEM